jgi:parvulin-like peptidyl-prolyl isomerase
MLGFIGKGTLSELSFEEKAFATSIGKYSEPFLSSLGWHIVKVLSKKNQQVEVQQIFIAIEPSKALEAQASARLDSIRAAVKAPADFIAAIRAFSTDKRTRDRDGDIGWITEYTLKSKYPESFADFQAGALSTTVPITGGFIMLMIDSVDNDRELNLVDDWDILFEKTRDIYAQKKLQELVEKWRTETLVDIRL